MEARTLDLEDVGMTAARSIGGDAIEGVQVEQGIGWTGEPKYDFWFLIDADRLPVGQGRAMTMLRLSLIDKLVANGDMHDPFVHFVDHGDWVRRGRA